ncbi:uncharacterized protein LOC113296600 [Papaver somniferum]|uniref:uncharacterized protein LOC113296600 n=1 Tax=Papaver somniferum TaxID=3469 RepID=UPI000E6F95CD|nr:uncharacterized protein LOC113296600 [Papaver somniferum]
MENKSLYSGYRVNRWVPPVSHMLFTKDEILFGTLDQKTANSVSLILQQYATWSGKQVNYNKSAIIFSKKVPPERQDEVTSLLGVKKMNIDDKYLYIQILKPSSRVASHEFLLDKFDPKLGGWKKYFLTHAGRTVLIQSVLALLPIYYMATTIFPKTVISKLNQTIRNFWWGHSRDEKMQHFIKWNWFIASKEKGSLGLRSLEQLNQALVAKPAWRFLQESNSIWENILREKWVPKECRCCNADVETVNHVFLQCPLAQAVLFASPLNLRLPDPAAANVKNVIADWIMRRDTYYQIVTFIWVLASFGPFGKPEMP